MPLYIAYHRVEQVTAKVSLTMIMLVDHVKKGSLPETLRCRAVLPTSSEVSISLWDASTAEELEHWLNSNLQYDSVHSVTEVQEEFAWGLTSYLTTQRAADKVAAGSRGAFNTLSATASKAGDMAKQQLEALDQKTRIISRIRNVGISSNSSGTGAPGDAAVVGAEDETAGGGGTTTGSSSTLAANMTAGLSKAGATFSWLGQSFKEGITTAANAARTAAGAPASGGAGASAATASPPPRAHSPMPTMPAPLGRYDSGAPKLPGVHSSGGGVADAEAAGPDMITSLDQLHQLPLSTVPITTTPTAASAMPANHPPQPLTNTHFTLTDDDRRP